MNRLKWDKANFGRIDKQMGYDLQISGEYSTNLFMCRRATGEAESKLSIGVCLVVELLINLVVDRDVRNTY